MPKITFPLLISPGTFLFQDRSEKREAASSFICPTAVVHPDAFPGKGLAWYLMVCATLSTFGVDEHEQYTTLSYCTRCTKIHDGFWRSSRASWFESGVASTSLIRKHGGSSLGAATLCKQRKSQRLGLFLVCPSQDSGLAGSYLG
ncbi:uncharacterized protein LOC103714320 [Phoenix dactylifera]|uniref:Uncharacterized protein LOC103714320 n=1 Tax=Phoenix dactylifera TaxID=42345 RepID=A0A8B8J875_PHODC|nr:uncharacterized protein LOC103714320 [Phoenix dactylifera]